MASKNQLAAFQIESARNPDLRIRIRKGADHEQLLFIGFTAVDVELGTQTEIFPVFTVTNHRQGFAKSDCFAIEMQQRIGISFLLSRVDFPVILIHGQPRRTGCEAGVFAVIPLHGRARGIAGGTPQFTQTLFKRLFGIAVGKWFRV